VYKLSQKIEISLLRIPKKEKKPRSSLKIFVIFFHPNLSVTAMGGAEKRFVETLKKFCREDFLEITVLEATPSLLVKPEITCKKYLLPLSFHGKGWLGTYLRWILWIIKASFKSFSVVCHIKPNMIYLPNNTLPNLISGYIVSSVFRLPMYVVVHHIDTPFSKTLKHCSLYGSYRNINYSKLVSLAKTVAFYITLLILRRAKGIITVSNFTARILQNNGVSGERIFVSGNAVDLKLISEVKPYSEKKIFDGVFVGRIAREKGIFDLLRVWKKVIKARKNAKLLIIGCGLELPLLKKEIVASGLKNNVLALGRCNDKEIYSLLKSSKTFIFPSLFEGWGIAIAEALACGLPAVAYDIPALREVFGECKSVFLVPAKNFESLSSTVLKVLNKSKKELNELSNCSKAYSKQFSWKKIAKRDLRVIKKFLKV